MTTNYGFKGLITHWTAGYGLPTVLELDHYHYLVDARGDVFPGKYKPEDNLDCTDNKYAAHTGGGNTGRIGVALCGMHGFVSEKQKGDSPVTKTQFESFCALCALLCKEYDIPVTSVTVMTHYEFGRKNRHTTSYGKPDITFLSPYPYITASGVGNFIRAKIRWYVQNSTQTLAEFLKERRGHNG